MLYKPDWLATRERLTALWDGTLTDRPCIMVTAALPATVPWPARPALPEQQWFDADWVLAATKASLANTYWGGEAIPSYLLMGGWALCYGARLQCAWETIWHEPVAVDYDTEPDFTFHPEDPWVRRYIEVYSAVLDFAGKDNFLVGQPCLLPASDLLPALLGTEEFLAALIEHRDWVKAALSRIAREQEKAFTYFAHLAAGHDFFYGSGGWMPMWRPTAYRATQSDVSCMLSPAMYEEFVMPELELLAADSCCLWYHLDGGNARQHLPSLLSFPALRMLQYTPAPCEPPNGPEHLDFYRQVQRAGKIVHIELPAQNVLPLAKALDPSLLCMYTNVASEVEADALMRGLERVA